MTANHIPPPGDWPWHEVIYRLRCRGLAFKDLAQAAGVHASAFCRVQHRPDPRRQTEIAAAIGLSPLAIWPTRYEPETGKPLTHREWEPSGEPQCTTTGQSPAAVGSSS